MQFLDWLDRHLLSNSHFYFYADELGWPMDYYPHGQTDDAAPANFAETQSAEARRQAEPH